MRDLKISELVELCNHTNCDDCEFFNANLDSCIFGGSIPIGWEELEHMKRRKYRELNETIDLMTSANYKDRFKAEYYQLKIRYEKLSTMLDKWDKDELGFTPTCDRQIYTTQITAMNMYLDVLEERAKIEGIELD